MKLCHALALMLLVPDCALAAQGGAQLSDAVQHRGNDSSYSVGAGDVLAVTVYRAPDYNSVVEVAEDGTIVLNAVGKVQVGGLTPAQVGDEISRRLQSGGIFRDPLVNVMVQTYRSSTVFVLGNVAKPGEYPLERTSLTITEVLARAGASLGVGGGSVRLLRKGEAAQDLPADKLLTGSLNQLVEPHDTLVVTESATFFVSGEVQRPGSFPLEPGLTMERAIALAGGVTQRGARSRLKVTRHQGEKDEIVKAKLQDPVRSGDLIMIGSRIF